MDMSLCILARGQPEAAKKLIDSVQAIEGLHVEVVVGENCRDEDDALEYRCMGDICVPITDKMLWDKGFGPVKQSIVDAASCRWVIIGDVGEQWHENNVTLPGFVKHIEEHPEIPCFRGIVAEAALVDSVLRGDHHLGVLGNDDVGRVLDRQKMEVWGPIHESPHQRYQGLIWAVYARRFDPIALIRHDYGHGSPEYRARKQALYDHHIHEIVANPSRRRGVDPYWWTSYWESTVKPRYKPLSFDEWRRMPG
jgi:hypothetical protein